MRIALEGKIDLVLTNEQALYGAGSLFYPQMMDQIADRMGSNYFVLPSSIHETLILVDNGDVDREALESMVQEINGMAVAPEDRLSDHVYHYDAEEHIFEKAETYENRMEQKEIAAEKAAMEAASKAALLDASKAEAGQEKSARETSAAEKSKEASDHNRAGDKEGKEQGHKDTRKEARQEKNLTSSSRDQRKTPPKKERKSVLARLNEKKEQLKAQPKKETPHRAKTNEIG